MDVEFQEKQQMQKNKNIFKKLLKKNIVCFFKKGTNGKDRMNPTNAIYFYNIFEVYARKFVVLIRSMISFEIFFFQR